MQAGIDHFQFILHINPHTTNINIQYLVKLITMVSQLIKSKFGIDHKTNYSNSVKVYSFIHVTLFILFT